MCEEETNMAVACMISCKICLIWGHIRTFFLCFCVPVASSKRKSLKKRYPLQCSSCCFVWEEGVDVVMHPSHTLLIHVYKFVDGMSSKTGFLKRVFFIFFFFYFFFLPLWKKIFSWILEIKHYVICLYRRSMEGPPKKSFFKRSVSFEVKRSVMLWFTKNSSSIMTINIIYK